MTNGSFLFQGQFSVLCYIVCKRSPIPFSYLFYEIKISFLQRLISNLLHIDQTDKGLKTWDFPFYTEKRENIEAISKIIEFTSFQNHCYFCLFFIEDVQIKCIHSVFNHVPPYFCIFIMCTLFLMEKAYTGIVCSLIHLYNIFT